MRKAVAVRSHRTRRSLLALVVLFAAWTATSRLCAEPPTVRTLWKDSYQILVFNEPICADVDLDGMTEILISGSRGQVCLVQAATGRLLWDVSLEGEPTLSPILGQFVNPSPIEVAVLHQDGRLHVLEAASGRVVLDARLTADAAPDVAAFTLAPSLLPARTSSDKDSILAVREDRRLLNLRVRADGSLEDFWAGKPIGALSEMPVQSPVAMRFGGPAFDQGVYGVAFATNSRSLAFADTRSPESPPTLHKPTNYSLSGLDATRMFISNASVWEDSQGLGRLVLWSDPLSRLVSLALDPSRKEPETGLFSGVDCIQQTGVSPVYLDMNRDGVLDILVNSETQISVLDGRSLDVRSGVEGRVGPLPGFTRYIAIQRFATPLAPFMTSEAEPFVAVGDEREILHLINLKRHATDPAQVLAISVGPVAFASPLVLDADGDGKIDVFVQNMNRSVAMIATSLPTETNAILWPTRGGSCMRTGGLPSLYVLEKAQERQSQKIVLKLRLDDARKAYEAGNDSQAVSLCDDVLKFNPRHREANEIKSDADKRMHRFSRFVLRGALLGVAALVFYGLWRVWGTLCFVQRTKEMAERGDGEALLSAFRQHMRAHKGVPTSAAAHLSRLCRKNDLVPSGMTAVLEKAHRAKPGDLDLALTLAGLYLEENRLGAETIPVFETARKESANPAPYNLALGRIHFQQGNAKLARTYLEDAYKQGNRSAELFETLALAYVELDLLTLRHLPVFELVAKRFPDNGRILGALAKSYIGAGMQKDPKAQEVFDRLARIEPDSPVANQEIAAAAFRNGDPQRAIDAARRALASEPENPTALLVCAWCLWQRGDTTEEARGIYLRAFAHHPNDSLLLRVVAQLNLDRSEIDDPTVAQIERAVESNPNDSRFLSATAAAALRWGRTALARRALESLCQMQTLCEEETLALARLYVADKETSPQSRDVLIRAFGLEPDMPGLAPFLGDILVREQRCDAAFSDLFTRLVESDPDCAEWTLHLARIYKEQGRFEAMARVLDPLHEKAPDETDVQRLLAEAHSNLKEFNKAIEHYKSVLASSPRDRQALVGLARTYALMDDRTQEMHDTIGEARALEPNDPLLAYAAGECALSRKKWGEAANCFHLAIGAGPERVEAILSRVVSSVKALKSGESLPARWLHVQVLLFLKRYDEILTVTEEIYEIDSLENQRILAVFDRILKEEPNHAAALFGRASMLKRQGDNVESKAVLERLLAIDPNREPAQRLLARVYSDSLSHEENSTLRFSLGRLLMKLGDYDAAVGCFQKTRQDKTLEKQSTRHLAECFYLKKMFDLALQELQNVPVDSETISIFYNLGKQFESLNNAAAARVAYQRIYAVDATHLDVAERINHLTQTSGIQLTGETQPIDRARATVLLDPSGSRHRYDLLEEIGRGAMSTVYRAHDNELDEIVALKILPENLLSNPEALRRFRLEARSARRLAHDYIVRIHDIGEEQDRKYISMEYVSGGTLRQLIHSREREITFDKIVTYAAQIAEAMAYAHRSGLIHRDLKPANIMLTEQDNVKITDFGIAKAITQNEQTRTGTAIGTPLYMSPEQVRGEPCDHRADIYSYGVVLYELVSGTPPFSQGDLTYQHLHVEPPPLDNAHPLLSELIMKCLRKSADERWASFDDILALLDRIKRGDAAESAS